MKLFSQGLIENLSMVEDAAARVAGSIGHTLEQNTYTSNVGGVSIVINASEGQSVEDLADLVEERINRGVMLSARAMA